MGTSSLSLPSYFQFLTAASPLNKFDMPVCFSTSVRVTHICTVLVRQTDVTTRQSPGVFMSAGGINWKAAPTVRHCDILECHFFDVVNYAFIIVIKLVS